MGIKAGSSWMDSVDDGMSDSSGYMLLVINSGVDGCSECMNLKGMIRVSNECGFTAAILRIRICRFFRG